VGDKRKKRKGERFFYNRKGERWAKRGRRPTEPGLLKEKERERRNRAGPKDRRLVWAKKRGGKETLGGRERELRVFFESLSFLNLLLLF
jgi:hypothetical protein